jgi:branched-chain amino acid transport system substrate-binding protein
MRIRILQISAAAVFVLIFVAAQAVAQKKYDEGATDSEIKIGNIMPYTGMFSEYGAIGRAEAAYFQMINDKGGINGRKIAIQVRIAANRLGWRTGSSRRIMFC